MNLWDRAVAAVIRLRFLALALSLGLTAVAVWLASGIPFASGVTEYLPASEPEVKFWLDMSKRFDAFSALMVGLEEPSAPLTAEGLQAMKRVTSKLNELKASGVLAARSIANIDSIAEGEDGALNNELLMPEVPSTKAGLDALSARIAGDLQVSGALVSRDQRAYVLLLRVDTRKDATEVATLVHEVVEKERGPLKAYYFGAPFFSAMITKKVTGQLFWLAPVFTLLLFGVLAVGVRRISVIVVLLMCAGAPLLWWLGLVRVFKLGLSQTSLNASLVLLVVALVAYARGLEARLTSNRPTANPFPAPVLGALAALALANLAMTQATIEYLEMFGATMATGLLAIALFGLLVFAPLASFFARRPVGPVPPRPHRSTRLGLAIALGVLVATGFVASGTRFHLTPQTMFSAHDEVGEAISFFDRRFGGADIIQIDFKADLRDPSNAARLKRLSDLIEGARVFPDVRSIAQILSFLSKRFGGLHRIPASRESLANLWFFLEGSSDVRNLVNDGRDEAMAVVRIPSSPERPTAELLTALQKAVDDSAKTGPEGARLGLSALARAFNVEVPAARLDAMLATAAAPPNEGERKILDAMVLAKMKTFLSSPDSPYPPTDEEWTKIAEAIAVPDAERKGRVVTSVAGIEALSKGGMTDNFVTTVIEHDHDMRLFARSQVLAQSLFEGKQVPEALAVRAQGVVADLLDPHAKSAAEAPVVVSGMPAVADKIERELQLGLWRAIATLLGLGAIGGFIFRIGLRKVIRGLIEGALATCIALAFARILGLGVDAGSATVYLIPSLLGFLIAGWVGQGDGYSRRLPAAFLLGLAASGLSLVFTGVMPIVRVGTGMAAGLCAVALVSYLSGLFRTEEIPGAAP